MDHYTSSAEHSYTYMINASPYDFPISLPIYLCMIFLHKGKIILLYSIARLILEMVSVTLAPDA